MRIRRVFISMPPRQAPEPGGGLGAEDFICAGPPAADFGGDADAGGGECEPVEEFVRRVIFAAEEEPAAAAGPSGGGGGRGAAGEDLPLERLFADAVAAALPPPVCARASERERALNSAQ